MRPKMSVAAAAVLLLISIAVRLGAQGPPAAPPGTPPGGAGQAPGGRGGGRGQATFPAQQRPPGDPAAIARGKIIYEINCRACHGPDLRGGDIGGPNLLRSQIVLNDQFGELIGAVITAGRQNPGMPVMPPLPLPPDDIKAIAAYVHSVAASMRGQGNPPPGTEIVPDVLVGDATAGRAYFAARCASCHSATGDLAGLATKVSSPMQLQNHWITGGGGGGGRGGRGAPAPTPGASARREVTVTVTQAGAKVTGRLVRVDDFIVILATDDGVQRSFRRNGAMPKVDINDPLEPHRNLLTVYTDKDIHDVTAYLVTLK